MSADLEQAITDVEMMLADPARHREIARRIVELERRCEQLAAEITRVDQRLTKARLERWDIP